MAPYGFPRELLELRRWVCWKEVMRDGRPTKLPRQPNRSPASSTEPATWHSFEDCLRAVGHRVTDKEGIGFVLAGDGLVGVDLDNSRDPESGELEEWANAIVDELDSYSDVSPSARGVHVWLRAAWDEPGRRRAVS